MSWLVSALAVLFVMTIAACTRVLRGAVPVSLVGLGVMSMASAALSGRSVVFVPIAAAFFIAFVVVAVRRRVENGRIEPRRTIAIFIAALAVFVVAASNFTVVSTSSTHPTASA